MLDLKRPLRLLSARSLILIIATCSWGGVNGEPIALSPRWEARFEANQGGKICQSTSVAAPDRSMLVTVVLPGANPSAASLKHGNLSVPSRPAGFDPVTRLGFLKIEGDTSLHQSPGWSEQIRGRETQAFQALGPSGPIKCHGTGFIGQIGGKVLPLALMQVRFDQAPPPPGTPLLDDTGKIVALIFQPVAADNIAYAVPAEAVHRVFRDIRQHGRLVRGWIGLSLNAETRDPQVVRVIPGSPAAAAGIRPNDVIRQIGDRPITNYPDAVDCFFYLIPGEAVNIKLLRGAEPVEFSVTPAIAKPQ